MQYISSLRKSYFSHSSLSSTRRFSTATDEKSTPPASELSENERKLGEQIEALNKDISSFKEKCSELDVSMPNMNFKINQYPHDDSSLQDKYKRSLADGENTRRRLSKQIEDAKLFGIQGFCKDLLSVSDILQTATESVPKDQVDSNPHLKNLYQGLSMTEAELQKVN